MYEELSLPIPDVNAYLRRIGLEGAELKVDLESLGRIMYAHMTHIPFENLDALEGKTPELGIPALFDKIILRRRGGWCYELNGLFHGLLEALGFESYCVGVRVMMGKTERGPMSHRGNIVILDGEKYYCDIGFGTVATAWPIPLSGGEINGFRAELDGDEVRIFQLQSDGTWLNLLLFADREVLAVDYITPNFYNAQDRTKPFANKYSISLLRSDGIRCQLIGSSFRTYRNDVKLSDTPVTDPAAVTKLLWDEFGIEYEK